MGQTVTIQRQIEAEQIRNGEALPEGVFITQPEVHWSAGRKFIYFTFAHPREFMATAWITAKTVDLKQESCEFVRDDAEHGAYGRKVLSFNFWSVKSEASFQRDWSPVFLDRSDADVMSAFSDYCQLHKWPDPLPARFEYREAGDQYGRGYAPHYLKATDWLLKETVPDGEGTKLKISVVDDANFQKGIYDMYEDRPHDL